MNEADRPKCQAVTKSGVRCRNNAVENSKYCAYHQDGQAFERIEQTTKSGVRKSIFWAIVVTVVVGGGSLAVEHLYLRVSTPGHLAAEEYRSASGHGEFGYDPMGGDSESWGMRGDVNLIGPLLMARVEEAFVALENEEYESAIEKYRDLLDILPDEPILHYNLGVAYTLTERWELAAESYNHSIALEDTLFAVYNNLGLVLNHLGRSTAAIVALRMSIELEPREAIVLSNLGLALKDADSLVAAAAACRYAIAVDPRLIPPYLILASTQIKLGAIQAAMDTLDLVLARGAPDEARAEAHFYRGVAFHKLDDFESANDEWSKCLVLDSIHYPAILNRASALLALHRCDSARFFVESIITPFADSADLYVLLGDAFLCDDIGNRLDYARQMYNRALKLDSCSARAYVGLGRIFGFMKVHDYALSDFLHAVKCDSNLQVAQFNAGAAMLITGDYAAAVRHLEIAVGLDPNDEDAQKYLREARQKLQAAN